MTALRIFGLGAALAVSVASTGYAQDNTVDIVVATVGGKEITVGHIIVARRTLPEQFAQLPPEVLWDGILEQLVQQNALALTATDGPNKGTKLALDNEETSLLAGQMLTEAIETAISDEDALKAIYAERYESDEPSKEYNAAHILVETEEKALEVKAEIEGGKDFAEAAKEHSTGPSGPNGGSLGWFGPGMMVAPFEEAVVAMEPGSLSAPVQTQFGWHLIQLIETRVKDAPPMESVMDELQNALRESAIEASIAKAVNATEVVMNEVEIDPSVLNQLELLEQ